MTITRFEDIDSWKQARQLTALIYSVTSKGLFRRDYGLSDQMRRACVSVMSNIAEGFGRHGKTEFARFLTIARASSLELRSQLYVALDLGHIRQDEFDNLFERAQSIEKLICGLMTYLRRAQEPRT